MDKWVRTLVHDVFTSPNEMDSNGETANTVDGLFAIARSIRRLAIAVENLAPPTKPVEKEDQP